MFGFFVYLLKLNKQTYFKWKQKEEVPDQMRVGNQ